ncbi:hypothetical protein GWN63_01120, partial [Candidatus Bathyarchaeota archaeon]|nr:hypothetical protein [Candidatus Bathyarchaeota archaeon]NIU80839.1 hypothetical protein [Candidatus Bathyarchaeota archaeon]NIW34117.1 hypothetical protein [Candidatus Bathyarchaeota archaeon]
AGKIYDRTHQYTSKFFDFLTAKMSLRGLKRIAEIGEHALEVKGKVDERIETIEGIKGEIRANHDNVTSLL